MKRKIFSFIIVIVILFGLAACDSLNLFNGNADKTTQSVDENLPQEDSSSAETADLETQVSRILEIIQNDDTQALLEWVHPLALEKYGEEQIVERNAKIHSDIGLKNIILNDFIPLGNTEQEGSVSYQGTAIYKTGYGDIEKEVTYNFIYHPNANRWQIDWTPSVILPGLHDQGLVQIQQIRATRGNIYDRVGKPLAHQGYINQIGIVPGEVKPANFAQIETLYELSEGFVQKQIAQEWVQDDTFVPLKTLASLTDEQKSSAASLGVRIKQVETRLYPLSEAAAHLIGYVGNVTAEHLEKEENAGLTAQDFIGISGLEEIYDKELRGEHGFKVVVTGDYEQVLLEKAVVNGRDLYLTIDSDLQTTIYETAKDKDATFTALDPRNGDILALVSTPSFNPNQFVLGISQEGYQALLENPMLPLNQKFSYAMVPGSTEKLITAIAGLNAGTLTLNTTYNIQGKGWTYDESWGNHQVIRYQEINGDMSLENALVTSDNIYFARVTLDMGFDNFNQQTASLLFGESICADYPFGKAQVTNEGPVTENTILLADAGYGQGELLISPVHLSSVYGAIANNGVWYRPRLLLTTEPEVLTQTITSDSNVQFLDASLRKVITQTYTDLIMPNVDIAGKTGTAEVGYDETLGRNKENSWLVSYDQKMRNMVLCTIDFNSHHYGVGYGTNTTKAMYEMIYADGAYAPPAAVEPTQIPVIE